MRIHREVYGCTRGPSPPWQWCGGCYANGRKRANYKGCLHYRAPPKPRYIDWSTSMKRPTVKAAIPGDRSWSCPDPWFSKDYPLLAAGLCDPFWDDGKARVVWTLKFTYGAGSCSVVLNDPGAKLVLFTTGVSLVEALGLIEEALLADTAGWRKSKY